MTWQASGFIGLSQDTQNPATGIALQIVVSVTDQNGQSVTGLTAKNFLPYAYSCDDRGCRFFQTQINGVEEQEPGAYALSLNAPGVIHSIGAVLVSVLRSRKAGEAAANISGTLPNLQEAQIIVR